MLAASATKGLINHWQRLGFAVGFQFQLGISSNIDRRVTPVGSERYRVALVNVVTQQRVVGDGARTFAAKNVQAAILEPRPHGGLRFNGKANWANPLRR